MPRTTHIQPIASDGKSPERRSDVPTVTWGAVDWQASANHNRLFHSALNTPSPLRACPGRRTGGGLGRGFFGARYYDADISVWLSVDPMSDERFWSILIRGLPLVAILGRLIKTKTGNFDGSFSHGPSSLC